MTESSKPPPTPIRWSRPALAQIDAAAKAAGVTRSAFVRAAVALVLRGPKARELSFSEPKKPK